MDEKSGSTSLRIASDPTLSSAGTGGPAGNEFLSVMQPYFRDGVIFASPDKGALYAVASIDAGGCQISRLNADEPVRCTGSGFELALRRLQDHGGRMPFNDTFASTVATRTSYLQAARLSNSADRSEVVELRSLVAAAAMLGGSTLRTSESMQRAAKRSSISRRCLPL